MPFGLRTYDSGGALEIDLTSRLFRILGNFRITTASGSFAVGNKSASTQLFVMQTGPYDSSPNLTAASWLPPTITISNNVISWNYPATSWPLPAFKQVDVVYGEF
ncbi:MAG: hypothetical protein LBU76_00755 [Azoarcus sp.]|jgi:hypothetical protein|nr:hypothetical protein [Azoarcus sp.]